MILGQDRAGKTSLKKSLLGMPFNPEEESTVGVEVDPSKCEVDVDQVTNWQRTEHTKLDVSHFVEDIARIVAKDLKETEEEPKKTKDVPSFLEQVKLILFKVISVELRSSQQRSYFLFSLFFKFLFLFTIPFSAILVPFL